MKTTENYITPAICFGEILWDVLPDGPQPGGAPLNVAYHLNKMGMATSLVSKIGNDEDGKKLAQLLDDWGIKSHLLQTDEEYPTSQVIAKMNNGNEVSYEIIYPVAWDFINYSDSITKQLQPSTYFIYGSLASRNETSRKTLFEILESDVIKVLDINMRPPYIGKDLLGDLLEKANIVKFNQAELEMVQMLFGSTSYNEAAQVIFIQHHFNISEVIITKGEFGASYYKNDKGYHVWGSEVKVVDTIGSGDSFLAAFLAGHYLNEEPQVILKNAIAMGGFIATRKGGCPDYQLSEYNVFREKIFKTKL
ncbi:fructokinase [Mucilaginibacter mallensis]|uniref:Fructokinase n=1 Tax=Mucilaginibacter mallensis TaxID=652787 RepID=A0A1H1ZGS7_MUCMA|nr:carbohydrate kinase [Mucilaginibacter mallensis]SDT32839.1 fructokinase [Mucilaginibacter mallensis]